MGSHWIMFPTFSLLLSSALCTSFEFYWFWLEIRIPDETYQDIESLNATCSGLDSCQIPRTVEAWKYNCNCDKFCSIFGTCCVDSGNRHKYQRKPLKNLECRMLNNKRDYLYPWIRTCNPDMTYDNTTEELCLGKGCKINDPLVEIPVTDPLTGITYNNYFCFACNENSGEERLIPWNVAVGGNLEKINKSSEIPTMQNYEKNFWTWVADDDNSTTYSIWPAIPEELEDVLPFCYGYEIHSECAPDWRDEEVRRKCLSYMAMARISNGTQDVGYWARPRYRYYRNPHCAICNYESLDKMVCVSDREYPTSAPGGLLPSGDFFVRIFSLHDKSAECRNGMVLDKFSKKCRNIYLARKLEQ